MKTYHIIPLYARIHILIHLLKIYEGEPNVVAAIRFLGFADSRHFGSRGTFDQKGIFYPSLNVKPDRAFLQPLAQTTLGVQGVKFAIDEIANVESKVDPQQVRLIVDIIEDARENLIENERLLECVENIVRNRIECYRLGDEGVMRDVKYPQLTRAPEPLEGLRIMDVSYAESDRTRVVYDPQLRFSFEGAVIRSAISLGLLRSEASVYTHRASFQFPDGVFGITSLRNNNLECPLVKVVDDVDLLVWLGRFKNNGLCS
ncbi:MAG: hypothetical protein K9N01_13260 [Cephaloticoccus sp.]|nr:hypothetical protein [Cephaloticoccus sp.]